MAEDTNLSSKDFDQFEIVRIIHLEQIPGYQLLKWERDYIKNYRKALKAEMKKNGVEAGGPMFDVEDDDTESTEEKASKKKTKTKTKTKTAE